MLSGNGSHANPQRNSSWAEIASDGKEQRQPSTQGWPVAKHKSVPQPDDKEARIALLVEDNSKLREVVERLKASTATLNTEGQQKAAQILKLEATLNEARKKILTSQPPQDVSDDQVRQAFEDLCENIEDFVDVNCGGLDSFEDRFSTQSWTDLELRIAEFHITEDDIKLSKEFPRISTHILMNAVFSLVYEYALRENSWIALAEKRKDEEFLNNLVDIMSTQRSFYDASTVDRFQSGLKYADNFQLRRWRSEVFRALKGAEYHVSKRRSGIAEWGSKAHFMLQHFVDEGKGTTIEKLKSKIIEPAYRLADMIKGSTAGYRFDFVVNSSSRNVYLEASDTDLYKVVNAHTGAEGDFEVATQNPIGRLRLCIFPSLEKVLDGGERVCMCKALVVVENKSSEHLITIIPEETVS